ncbi:hypothetical protein DL771_008665 [Monosporascus sp. 5C6A]|nr:hypothetical protein DL771_008665 [Monosporascus sp. 5C6A]
MIDDGIRQKHPETDVEKADLLNRSKDAAGSLGDVEKMKMSEPTFPIFAVLGINTYAARHHDQTDVKHGLTSLLPLGDYQETEPGSERYDPCYMGPLSPEPEELTAVDIHWAGIDDTSSSSFFGSGAPKSSRNGVVRNGDPNPRPTERLKAEDDVT